MITLCNDVPSSVHYKPAELGVDILEGGCQDASDVRHVEVKQGNPKKRIHHRGNLAQRRFRRQVSITFVDKCEIDMSTNICASLWPVSCSKIRGQQGRGNRQPSLT